jgi:NADH dehydrogenase [ubiquinone] 1 alpha subcomplex assembly factor 7
MTPLEAMLIERIRATGPLTLAEYMAECLLHPAYGYYATRDPFGQAGDFITAPEVSQMFGELVGLCLAQCWIDQRRPSPITLAEIGPGRGTLMADILRVAGKVLGFMQASEIHLVEASPTLREIQRNTLSGHSPVWHERVTDLPEGPLFLVANEFFDALPIRQFVLKDEGWAERHVAAKDGQLSFALAPARDVPELHHRVSGAREGDVIEICPAAAPIVTDLGGRIARHGGVALIIDYGDRESLGDTFQALRAHKHVSPLDHPGESDLTAHVDFGALAAAALTVPGIRATELTTQGVFLERLGITGRARALAGQLAGEPLERHILAHRRLTHPEEMGTVFKVIAIHPDHTPAPPGLSP